jgi:hypothetical protein
MKNLFILPLLFCAQMVLGQISINNSILYAAADTLVRFEADSVGSATVTPSSSTAQTWNFSFLTSSNPRLFDSVRYASSGSAAALFPNADILITLANGLADGYVDVDSTEMKVIGASLDLFGQSFTAAFTNTQILQKVPFTYNTTFNDNYNVSFTQLIDSIPMLRSLLTQLSPLTSSADSIRISLLGSVNLNADAFGTCQLANKTADVIRQKVTLISEIKIELRTIFGIPPFQTINWIDPFGPLFNLTPPFPLKDTTYRYDFWTNWSKVPVVRFNMDSTGTEIQSIEYNDNFVGSSVIAYEKIKDIHIFPNPSADLIMINTDLTEGQNYQLSIVDGMGRVLQEHKNLSEATTTLSLKDLPSGIFYLFMLNDQGALIGKQRIQKI